MTSRTTQRCHRTLSKQEAIGRSERQECFVIVGQCSVDCSDQIADDISFKSLLIDFLFYFFSEMNGRQWMPENGEKAAPEKLHSGVDAFGQQKHQAQMICSCGA